MSTVQYTDTVGYKFYKDGRVKEFFGATIISFLYSDDPLFSELKHISEEMQKAYYAHKFSFLPPSSYHMTNFILYNDNHIGRNKVEWSAKIPDTISHDEINTRLYAMLRKIHFPLSYRMKIINIHDDSLRVAPATEKSAQALKKFRDDCTHATGIRFSDHETYEFHITYAYRIIELDDTERTELQMFLQKQLERLQHTIPEFDIAGPTYCTFQDMSHFEPYRSCNNI